MQKPTITIFGLGRVGSALQKALSAVGYELKSTFSSKDFPISSDQLGDIIFITTPDSEIENLANKIADSFSDLNGILFVHCSGTKSSATLESVRKKGAKTGSFHPMKSVTPGQDSFSNVWFDIEGEEEGVTVLKQLAKDLGAKSIVIDQQSKVLLHAAAVMASNYFVTILKSASEVAEMSNIDESKSLEILLPLAESTLQNIKENGIPKSLTGPVARGDIETIETHVKLLKKNPELLSIYKKLGWLTVDIAELNSVTEETLKNLFKE